MQCSAIINTDITIVFVAVGDNHITQVTESQALLIIAVQEQQEHNAPQPDVGLLLCYGYVC